jgi:periplasmic protein TonB
MTTHAPAWFEDDPPEIKRWAIAAAIVVAVHVAAIGTYAYVHQPDEIGDDAAPIAVDFAPGDDKVDQAEVVPTPEQPPPQAEEPPPPPPPPPETQAVVTPEPPPPPPKVEEAPQQQAQPARTKGGAPSVISPGWTTAITKRLQQVKRYPSNAHNAVGTVSVSFTVDRTGHVLSRKIEESSGSAELDAEALAMIVRAQLPPFPDSMTQSEVDLTVPIHFSLER